MLSILRGISPLSLRLTISVALALSLSGCLYKVVTVPVGLAYKTTKVAVKGTAMVVGAVIPDGDDDEKSEAKSSQDAQQAKP